MLVKVKIVMERVSNGTNRLDLWIRDNGWDGWDPYDLNEISFFRKIKNYKQSLTGKIAKKAVYGFADLYPVFIRKLFRIQPRINAKGMGLFLCGYAILYRLTKNKRYLGKAIEYAEWLIQNRNTEYSGYSWGYPFDWWSVRFIPEGTPSSVVTSVVGDGFYHLYEATADQKYLDICNEICVFFLENLNLTYESSNNICYSYTPMDDYQVHNANLFVGEFLARTGKKTANTHFIEQGIRCGNFALMEQQPEGYLPYWGLAQTKTHSGGRIRTNHYHSGFEIRMLFRLWKHTARDEFQNSYQKYYQWYLKNMFLEDHIPKMTPYDMYPINIHSCAEALLCQAALLLHHPERLAQIMRTVAWIVKKMEYKPGEYVYLIKKLPVLGEWRIKIPMIRWGQAWMFRAYCELLINGRAISKSEGKYRESLCTSA